MSWLLWREYRLNRLIAGVGLGLVLLPYLFAGAVMVYMKMFHDDGTRGIHPEGFGAAAMYSIGFAQLTLVLLGGNAIAGERADRSAEFMAHLPISRASRLSSKLCLSGLAALLIWGANVLVLLIVARMMWPLKSQLMEESLLVLSVIAVSSLTAYSVAWLVSSLQSSPTFAVSAGLVTPLATVAAIQAVVVWVMEIPQPGTAILVTYCLICGITAICSFFIGTWYFLQRIEP